MSIVDPLTAGAQAQRDLAIVEMNRGHALMLAEELPAALQTYDEAIVLLRPLVSAATPGWGNSFGAALMNRGQLLHRMHGAAHATDALAAFDEAAAVLRPLSSGAANPWPRRNLAGTLLNRANLLLDLARWREAVTNAREALALCQPHEHNDLLDADLALKTRRAACDALGQFLIAPGADQEATAAEASDLVDEALALIRQWRSAVFQPLAARFFRYGAGLYRRHQSQFLAEFLTENLPLADGEFRAIALETIDQALAGRDHTILRMDDPATERHLQIWRELEALRPRFVQ